MFLTKKYTIDLSILFAPHPAKLARLEEYIGKALEMCPPGADATLTGAAPVWLYLKIAHALHGRAKALYYESPVAGKVEIFNHDPE